MLTYRRRTVAKLVIVLSLFHELFDSGCLLSPVLFSLLAFVLLLQYRPLKLAPLGSLGEWKGGSSSSSSSSSSSRSHRISRRSINSYIVAVLSNALDTRQPGAMVARHLRHGARYGDPLGMSLGSTHPVLAVRPRRRQDVAKDGGLVRGARGQAGGGAADNVRAVRERPRGSTSGNTCENTCSTIVQHFCNSNGKTYCQHPFLVVAQQQFNGFCASFRVFVLALSVG